jgi:glycosyltransferase involved in cell wall biosynthesis
MKLVTNDYEMIFVNDGSRDRTRNVIEEIATKDKKMRLINLRKNFGKADALSVGFKEAKGDIIITMDGDLQDDPAEIPRFVEKMNEGYDLVSGWKFRRHDPITKTIPSRAFNKLTGIVSGLRIHDFNCGFKAYKKELAKNLRIYGELHRYVPALAYWDGYRIGEIKVRHHKRMYGKSKYGFARLLKGFFDLLTIKYLSTYRSRPLHLFGSVGLVCIFLGSISGLYLLDQWIKGLGIGHRPLLTLSILLSIMGIQFITTGFLAEMVTNNSREDLDKKIKH